MKVLFFMGSRSNYGRLKYLYESIKRYNEVCVVGACTLDQIKYNIETDLYISADMYTDSSNKESVTQGIIAITVSSWLKNKTFDYAICHGDRFETLGFAQAVASARIKLVHLEAGELSMVDNKTRWAISALSDIHLCHSSLSYDRLLGLKEAGFAYKPYFVGSPSVDYIKSINFSKIELKNNIIIGYNPVNTEEFEEFTVSMEKVIKSNQDINFMWINPNIDVGFKKIVDTVRLKLVNKFQNLEFVKNLAPIEYLKLLYSSIALVGNASSGIKESYILGVPYIMYGFRQASRETFKNTEYTSVNFTEVLEARLNYFKTNGHYRFNYDGELGTGGTNKKILEILKENINDSKY